MLSKQQRIPRYAFKPLLESRKYIQSVYFSLRMAPSPVFKAAVSVSKKVSKQAVGRNHLRRRAYSALKELFPQLKSGLYLFVAKPGSEKLKVEEIIKEFATLIKKS